MNYANDTEIRDVVASALKEDIGSGDITSKITIPERKSARAVIIAKDNFIVCGLNIAGLTFKLVDKNICFTCAVSDGAAVKKGKILVRISGNARSILAAERTAVNFLSLLSGVATKTKKYVKKVKPYSVKILDTRKTIPGLRLLEKYAVRMGGGFNHRMGLDDMILVKDNHLKVIGGVDTLSGFSRKHKSEVEVKNLKELKHALQLNPDIIMLDNMGIAQMKRAVRMRNAAAPNRCHLIPKLEASGGITLKTVKKVAATGVDMISTGDLTSSVQSVDISLEIL